jgi:hypothetical protein
VDTSQIYDQFMIFTAQNQQYLYMVKKLTGGWSATTGYNPPFGGITSYFTYGQLRMKHHIQNNNLNYYAMYFLGIPWTRVYTVSFSASFANSYRTGNYYGQWYIDNIDTQVKINGWNSWHFVSINTQTAYNMAGNSNDPSEKVV